ncbi:hypothetical protein [Azospirillum sp. B4]|uniref:hypothetical protein n=1 Tax=Azospirillum sp. B4 TaxID=95605 RepID=UPI0011DC7C82|nr:hypothetical protein [Azospirillum sp. B4]
MLAAVVLVLSSHSAWADSTNPWDAADQFGKKTTANIQTSGRWMFALVAVVMGVVGFFMRNHTTVLIWLGAGAGFCLVIAIAPGLADWLFKAVSITPDSVGPGSYQ